MAGCGSVTRIFARGTSGLLARGRGRLLVLLVAGATTGGCGDTVGWRDGVYVHNRTTGAVSIGYSDPIDPCDSRLVPTPEAATPRADRPLEEVWHSRTAVAAPVGYEGPISLVISEQGETVVFGTVDAADLPACNGSPPDVAIAP